MSGPRLDPTAAAKLYDQYRDEGLSHDEARQRVLAEVQHENAAATSTGQPTIGPDQKTGVTPAPYGLGNDLAQGLSFGFGDELGAALKTGSMGGPEYDKARAEYLAGQHAFHAKHPIAGGVAEFAGAVLPAVASGGLTEAAPVLGKAAGPVASALRAMRGGAAYGAVAGAGNADPGQRMMGAGIGAAAGATMGAGVPAASRIMSGGADVLGLRGAESAGQRADQLLAQSLRRDEMPPGTILTALRSRQGAKPETIADLAGENTRGLARAAQATPSKAKQGYAAALEERQANQSGRVSADLERGMGLTRQDTGQVIEDLIAQRSKNAAPLYQKAYQHGAVDDPRINELLGMPWFKEANARAQRLAQAEGVTLPADGKPTVQSLDYLKRGLDDFLQSGAGKEGGLGPTERAAVRKLKNEMLQRLDQAVPDYGAARSQYAGDSALRDAVEEGRGILKADPRVVAKTVAGLSPGEQQMYKLGALDAVRRRMDASKDGRDLTKVIFGDQETRARLQPLFPTPAAYQEFADDVGREATMAKTRSHVMGNSVTGRLQAEMADMGGVDPATVAQAATGNVGGAAITAMARAIGRRAQGVTGEVADQLSTRFQSGIQNRGDLEQLLQVLESVDKAGAARAAQKSVTGRALATESGSLLAPRSRAPAPTPPTQTESLGAGDQSDLQKQPSESLEVYAQRLQRSGVSEKDARALFVAQGLARQ